VTCRPLLPAAALVLLLPGCVSQPTAKPPPEPFVFRSLNLRQQDKDGAPAWELSSPEARYDINRRVAQARQPRGVIYLRGKPRYRIAARSGTVIGDGQAVQLEGDVSITLLDNNPVRITGDQVRWLPSQNLMLIDRRPVATDRKSRLKARTARFLVADDRIELRGNATLEQWEGQGGRKPQVGQGPAPFTISTAAVDWKPNNGALTAPAGVTGERSLRQATGAGAGGTKASADQTLTASGLNGNLRQGFVDLLAPVRLVDRVQPGWLKAERTRWAINDQTLTSEQPFSGKINKLAAQGARLQINLAQATVLVPQACALQQPGESLTAERCLWHWTTGRFDATGSVVLRRQAYKQITRANSLQGQIGNDGTAIFTSPGARVFSAFTLPKGQQPSGQRRTAAPPIAF
jgi:LPS export ABC transporter protein LptC